MDLEEGVEVEKEEIMEKVEVTMGEIGLEISNFDSL